jgi:hypothetical protein
MRKITIVGAGQAGLMLGIGLRKQGFAVRIYSDRNAEQIHSGRILSNQCMWHGALEIERQFGLQYWDEDPPKISGFELSVVDRNQGRLANYIAPLSNPGQSVDQRLKIPVWMGEFERLGGELIIKKVDIDDLNRRSQDSDLVILAAGKGRGELKTLFEVDETKTLFHEPQRFGASVYTTGRKFRPKNRSSNIGWTIIPGVGEFWIIPAQSKDGPCHIICLQGVVGGPMDIWDDVDGPDQHLKLVMELVNTWLPWERDLCRDVTLTDPKAFLSGGVPCITHVPVRKLPSGRSVLAIGDSHVLNDPICQQGSNVAARAADSLLNWIVERSDQPFDEEWMMACGDRLWTESQKIVRLTKQFLHPPNYFAPFLASAENSPELASLIADANDSVDLYFPWLEEEDAAASLANGHGVNFDLELFN